MENIRLNRINEILQEKADKPVPLTSNIVEQNGFVIVWGAAGMNSYFNTERFPFLITETVETAEAEPVFTFDFEKQRFTLQYEHQLQRVIEAFN